MALNNSDIDKKIDKQKDKWRNADKLEKEGKISKDEADKRKKEAHEEAEKIRSEAGRRTGSDDGSEDKEYRGKYNDKDRNSDKNEKEFVNLRKSALTDLANSNTEIIRSIARKNKVDMGVAKDMFQADIKNNLKGSNYSRYGDFEITDGLKNDFQKAYEYDIANMDEKNYNAFEAAQNRGITFQNSLGNTSEADLINNHLNYVRSLINPDYKPGTEFNYPGSNNKVINPPPSVVSSSSSSSSNNYVNNPETSVDSLINTLIDNNLKLAKGKNPYKPLDLGYDRSRERQRDKINDKLTDMLIDSANKEYKPLTKTDYYNQFKKKRR